MRKAWALNLIAYYVRNQVRIQSRERYPRGGSRQSPHGHRYHHEPGPMRVPEVIMRTNAHEVKHSRQPQ